MTSIRTCIRSRSWEASLPRSLSSERRQSVDLVDAVAGSAGEAQGNSRSFTFEEIRLVGDNRVIVRYIWHLVEGDNKYAFDIDLPGVRAHRLEVFDDPRAITAARSVGAKPFRQPVFQNPEVIDGVSWVKFGAAG
ncbi:hypothetical protein [Rhodococcus triatomae]|nr:hypothetical protein G419_03923 [Rhodococcus triatomae BKS 15-14]